MLILWRLQNSKKRQISSSDYWSNRTGPCSAAPLSIQSSYCYKNTIANLGGGVLGHCIDAKISPKAASEKAQTTLSENRYTSSKIDVFWTAILTLLAPIGNNAWTSFLVHQVLCTSTTVLWYRRMFTQFPSVFECLSIPVVRWLLTYSIMSLLWARIVYLHGHMWFFVAYFHTTVVSQKSTHGYYKASMHGLM